MSEFDINRRHYAWFQPQNTRWIDNDAYGHVNNAVYYTYFDTITNCYLIEKGGLDIQHSPVIGFIVASSCQYRSPVSYPQSIDAGLRVNRIGNASVEYGVAVFHQGVPDAAAHGTFTHVFVDRATGDSVRIPETLRGALQAIYRQRPTG